MSIHVRDYAIFGGRLRSPIPFPELLEHAGDGPCDWRLSIEEPVPLARAELLRELRLSDTVGVDLYRHEEGFRLSYNDTGTFDVSADGRRICWRPAPDAPVPSARLDVIGLVLALALHASGVYTLHGSAVSVASGVIGFVAPRGHGKSTLALSLVLAGGRLVTDDSLAVLVGGPRVMASPGVHSVRLRDDAFQRLGSAHSPEAGSSNGKRLLQMQESHALEKPAPLEAVYLLQPVTAHPERDVVRRALLQPRVAGLVLAGHSKLAGLLEGTTEAATLLRHAADVAAAVPVYALEVVRDLDRLPEVVDTILRWHSGNREGVVA